MLKRPCWFMKTIFTLKSLQDKDDMIGLLENVDVLNLGLDVTIFNLG